MFERGAFRLQLLQISLVSPLLLLRCVVGRLLHVVQRVGVRVVHMMALRKAAPTAATGYG